MTRAPTPAAPGAADATPRHDDPSNTQDARRRLSRLAWALDAQFRVPVLGVRFGLDSLIGLIPGVGDFLTAGISLYIVYQAGRLGASKRLRLVMLGNVLIDAVAGTIPGVGDAFDVLFKANVRNLRLLGITPTGRDAPRRD